MHLKIASFVVPWIVHLYGNRPTLAVNCENKRTTKLNHMIMPIQF